MLTECNASAISKFFKMLKPAHFKGESFREFAKHAEMVGFRDSRRRGLEALLLRCAHSNVFLSPIQQDYDASPLDPMSISEYLWFGTGVGDVVRRRLGGVHGHVPMSARHRG
jgi:hypothetical protein